MATHDSAVSVSKPLRDALWQRADRIYDAQALVRMVRIAIDDEGDHGHSAARALRQAEQRLGDIADSCESLIVEAELSADGAKAGA